MISWSILSIFPSLSPSLPLPLSLPLSLRIIHRIAFSIDHCAFLTLFSSHFVNFFLFPSFPLFFAYCLRSFPYIYFKVLSPSVCIVLFHFCGLSLVLFPFLSVYIPGYSPVLYLLLLFFFIFTFLYF